MDNDIPQQILDRWDDEKSLILNIGSKMGYGRIMQLAQECWRETLIEQGLEGGEFQSGPCVDMTNECGCESGCDWCGGSGWLTKHVKHIKDTLHNNTHLTL